MDDLRTKVAIVTGAGSGIGRAAAIEFATAGARVVLVGRNAQRLEQSLRLVEARGAEALCIPADVSVSAEVQRVVDGTLERFGSLECAFNNAAVFGRFGLLHEETEENFNAVVGTNLMGVWLCMKHQILAMLGSGGGSIVNCSSISGVIGHPRGGAYSASKHGVIGLSKSAALQYAREGIRINAICPGATDTEMLRSLYSDPGEQAARAEALPLGRFAQPAEIARVALWLSSDASSFVTGQTIIADGGLTVGQIASETQRKQTTNGSRQASVSADEQRISSG
jgi:NAD(P)-dependent dehydrogenase (short-subunit alcohol dehydrogenase family)